MLSVRGQGVKLLVTVALAAACGCKKDNRINSASIDPLRSGSSLNSTEPRYYDGGASLSDDATLVAFISGRDSAPGQAVRKAYKATWPKGAEPGALTRVTSSTMDLGNEMAVVVSPDGKWLALQVVKGNQQDLYLQDSAGQSEPARITSDAAIDSGMSFSPDSQLLAWVKSDPAAKTGVATVAKVGAAAVVSQQAAAANAVGEVVNQVFWLPVPTGYTLVTATSNPSGTLSSYKKHSFSDLNGLPSAAASSWLTAFPSKALVLPSAAGDQALVVRRALFPDGSLDLGIQTEQIGDGIAIQPPPRVNVNAEAAFINTSSGETLRYEPKSGYDVAAAALTADGTVFLLGRYFYRCSADSYDRFGAAFAIGGSDHKQAPQLFSPRLVTGTSSRDGYKDAFDGADGGPCHRTRDDHSVSRTDDKMLEMAVMHQSTASNFRLAYVTSLSPAFDIQCNYKAGDGEVWLVDGQGEQKRFFALSQNRQVLTDDDRDGAEACPWPLGVF